MELETIFWQCGEESKQVDEKSWTTTKGEEVDGSVGSKKDAGEEGFRRAVRARTDFEGLEMRKEQQ